MKIGIIIGSIRRNRNGKGVGDWVAQHAPAGTDTEFVTLDLTEFDLPLLTSATLPAAAERRYDTAEVTRWSQTVESCDGFVFVTPEYNHGVPGAFKNAVDTLASEWAYKTVAFVSYGADGGIRAVEQWRQIAGNLKMLDVRSQVALSLYNDFGDQGFDPTDRRESQLTTLFDDLLGLTAKVAARAG